MRVLLAFQFLCCASVAVAGPATDSAGRMVDLPDKVGRLYASGPPASVLVYALAPDTLIGWPRALRRNEMPYIAEAYRNLPDFGRLMGRGGTANLEVVIREKPNLMVGFGSVPGTYISLADAVQKQTGIHYILIDGRSDATPAAFRILSMVLGQEERGERQSRYAETLFAELEAKLKDLPREVRPRVYLARRADGLESGAIGSINTEILERAGGQYVSTRCPAGGASCK